MTIVFAILAVLALVLALHPYITFPLSLLVLAKLRRTPEAPQAAATRPTAPPLNGRRPTVAIMLCVYNEEAVIERRIQNLIKLADEVPGTEIHVYSDGSDDGTVEILSKYQGRINLVPSTNRHGKTHGMNLLVTQTEADLIVFTDAAVRMNADSLPNMIKHFDDPDVGCVCGRIIAVDAGTEDEVSVTTQTSIQYWAFDAMIRRLETKIASVMGAHGPLFAIRREAHEPAPVEFFDDFYVSMAVLYNGHRIVQAEDFCGFKAVAAKRKDEFRRKIRIACQSFHIHRIMKPRLKQQTRLVRYLYAGHKTLRWLTIFSLTAFALFGSLAFLAAGLWLWVVAAWAGFGLCLGLGFAGVKPFNRGLEALAAFVANGIGVLESVNGKIYQTWATAKSARQAG